MRCISYYLKPSRIVGYKPFISTICTDIIIICAWIKQEKLMLGPESWITHDKNIWWYTRQQKGESKYILTYLRYAHLITQSNFKFLSCIRNKKITKTKISICIYRTLRLKSGIFFFFLHITWHAENIATSCAWFYLFVFFMRMMMRATVIFFERRIVICIVFFRARIISLFRSLQLLVRILCWFHS